MSDLLSVLVRENVSLISLATRAGQVITISPAHPAYETIRSLALSRDDDDRLLTLAQQTTHTEADDDRENLIIGDDFTSNGHDVWRDNKKIPDALASELLFLIECIVNNEEPDDLNRLTCFIEKLMDNPHDKARDDLTSLHVKHLLPLNNSGEILTTPHGILFRVDPHGKNPLNPSDITSVSRREEILLTTT